jgi:HK97 gp10 family phage protein
MSIERATNYVNIEANGFSEVMEALKALPADLQKNAFQKAFKRALAPVLNAAISNAPVGETGNLANGIKVGVTRRGGWISGQVKSNAPHSYLIEFGHRIVGPKPNLKDSGRRTTPNAFMRKALDSNANRVIEDVSGILNEEVVKAQKKIGGGGA